MSLLPPLAPPPELLRTRTVPQRIAFVVLSITVTDRVISQPSITRVGALVVLNVATSTESGREVEERVVAFDLEATTSFGDGRGGDTTKSSCEGLEVVAGLWIGDGVSDCAGHGVEGVRRTHGGGGRGGGSSGSRSALMQVKKRVCVSLYATFGDDAREKRTVVATAFEGEHDQLMRVQSKGRESDVHHLQNKVP